MDKLTVLPVAPLRDGPVFAYTDVPLLFGRNKSIAALKNAADTNRLIFVVAQRDPSDMETNPDSLYTVGTICQIKHIFFSDTEINVLISGLARAKVKEFHNDEAFLTATVEEIPDSMGTIGNDPEIALLVSHILQQFQNAIKIGRTFDFFILLKITSGLGPAELANQMAAILDFSPAERQALLEETNIKLRLQKIAEQLAKEIKVIELEKKIITASQSKFDKNVKKNLLEDRKRAIEEELGEMTEEQNEVMELRNRAKKANMPDEVYEKTMKEIKRLEGMNAMNPETGYIKNYVEWLLDMPWSIKDESKANIKESEKILDEDHYGLLKVKERILEYLSVLKLKQQAAQEEAALPQEGSKSNLPVPKKRESTPTILCFVGPPGVGKTSLGKSIAKSLGRKFVRISLGGVRDEAEIRGHRRTYVGALPGRIIQGIKQAGTNNPVFMLDEIDKVGADFRGDPSAALLEALDPEQNTAFSDHYLEVPFDLSEVIFITTANVLDTIPHALLDRLEVIEFPGYTLEEKFHIAKKYLVPKQLGVNGVKSDQVDLPDQAIKTIISRYTMEAGVRNLEREIATVLRKIAKSLASGEAKSKVSVRNSSIHKYLGPHRFTSNIAERKDEIGLATGLAWTQVGGHIIFIEVATYPGKGNLILTGQLGEVMQESAKAALSYVRSRAKDLGIDEKLFHKTDIHVHVPAGATPKDGPSAGLAMTTALASAMTKVPVRKYVAITGEVTLRGRANAIGGVKEKVIGAHLAGIKTVVLPKENKKDIEDIPKNVLKELEIKFVNNMDEVLDIALASKPKGKRFSKERSGPFATLEIPINES